MGGLGPPTSSLSTNLMRGLVSQLLFRVPQAGKALYIYKHPCLLWDLNPGPSGTAVSFTNYYTRRAAHV
ncbi:hypothetical protein TNCV_1998511 [Trichonephila clavipes]|nr:hypothetical protein TNCV_1998511 [Trichonephila clavipes]